MKKNYRKHFRRFEFKYILPAKQSDLIIPYITNYMKLDDFARSKGFYNVNSIYFDNYAFKCYEEKISGISPRKKYRIRFYDTHNEENNYFIEIKRRYGFVIVKDREPINIDSVNLMDFTNQIRKQILINNNNSFISEFYTDFNYYQLQSKIFINYKRLAYISKYNPNVRITFDYQIRSKKTDNFHVSAWKNIYPELVVMELKCNSTIPWWFNRLIHNLSLEKTSYSKYALSVNSIYNKKDYLEPI